jgi:hypothetical protein
MNGFAGYDDAQGTYGSALSYSSLGSTGGSGQTITLKAGLSHKIDNVQKFSVLDSRTVVGQQVGRTLHLVGLKVGTTTVKYTPVGSTNEVSVTVKVEQISKEDALKVAQAVFDKVKRVTNRPRLQLDWNDAEVLRNYRQTIRDILRPIRNSAEKLGYERAKNRLNFLLMVLDVAQANPHLVTLHQVLQEVKKQPWGDAASFHKVCVEDFKDSIPFKQGYDFAAKWTTIIDVASVVTTVVALATSIAASIFTGGASAGLPVAKVAGALTAAAGEIKEFSHSPKRLVADFGRAICAARDREILPARVEAAAGLRATVLSAYQQFKSTRNSSAAIQAQAALAELLTLDEPGFFATYRPEEDRKFKAARDELNRIANGGTPVDAPKDTRLVSMDVNPALQRALSQQGGTRSQLRGFSLAGAGDSGDQKKERLNTAIVVGAGILFALGIGYAMMRKG